MASLTNFGQFFHHCFPRNVFLHLKLVKTVILKNIKKNKQIKTVFKEEEKLKKVTVIEVKKYY